jgi:hypothetical protein
MREIVLAFVCALICVAAATAQTAKDYYKELHDANGLNPLMMFACFPEHDTGYFDTIALTRTFQKTVEEKHLKLSNVPKGDMLYVRGFYWGFLDLRCNDAHSGSHQSGDMVLFGEVEKSTIAARGRHTLGFRERKLY